MNNIKEKVKQIYINYLKKGQYDIQKLLITIIVSILIASTLVLINPIKVWDRVPIFTVIFTFIFLHFIYPIKDIYEFIYKKRYLLAIIFMIYVVVMGYSGSSIGTYAEVIQGEYQEKNYTPILGKYRSIRSDEWSVNVPIYTSQAIDEENSFAYYNDNLRGTQTDMSSIGNAPVLDILIIAKPFNIGYILFGAERGLSFLWYGKLVALLLVSFEFCMLLTQKNKLVSLCGMLAITFSAATQWWYSTEFFIYGMLVIILFDKFMLAKKLKDKLLYALGITLSGLAYIFIFYPAWQLTYGYVYLALVVWICIKNRKEYKINLRDVIIVICVLLIIASLLIRYYMKSYDALNMIMSTDYPGERFELGGDGNGTKVVFSYVYSFLFPYVNIVNPCEYSGMISFYPIPMIVAFIYLIRNRKDKETWKFIIPMLLVALLLSVWTFVKTNKIFAKITFLYMVPTSRCAVTLGFTQLLLIIYMLGKIKENDIIIKNENIKKILAVLASVAIVWIAQKTDLNQVMENTKLYVCGLVTLFAIYQILNINKQNNKNKLICALIIISIITGTTVNPVQKGITVLTNKPIAQKVQEIVKNDKENNLWIVENTNFYIPNYILANGAKVINSTNIYPNFELYEVVLGEDSEKEEIRSIYNRYAHLLIEVSDENKVELVYSDCIKLYITTEKLQELGIKYIVSTRQSLDEFETEFANYEQLYYEYGIGIYKLNY
jgi:hypothetical protein